jgi:hypothetical protein
MCRRNIVDGKRRAVALADPDQLDVVFGRHVVVLLSGFGRRHLATLLKAEDDDERYADRAEDTAVVTVPIANNVGEVALEISA